MRIFLVLLLAAITGAAGWYFGSRSNSPTSSGAINTETVSATNQVNKIVGLGKLEPASGIIKILAPQGQKIETLFDLEIGDAVELNQPIAQLAGRKARELELQIARAKKQDALNQLEVEKSKGTLKQASAQLAVEQAASLKTKINERAAMVQRIHDQRTVAADQLQRLLNIDANPLTTNMVGRTDLEKQRMLIAQLDAKIDEADLEAAHGLDQASRARQAAENDLKTVTTVIDNAEKSVPLETINAAIEAAETALDLTELKAPIAGTILDIIVRPGDSVTNQPVMVIGQTDEVVCVAEVNDFHFRFVQVGDAATVSSNALDGELTGRVISKGIMIGPPSMKDPNPFASVDRKTGRVVIAIDDTNAVRELINLQVDVAIEVNNSEQNLESMLQN